MASAWICVVCKAIVVIFQFTVFIWKKCVKHGIPSMHINIVAVARFERNTETLKRVHI